MTFKFNLGDTLKDKITGFQGVAVARTEWLNGCIRYNVQPRELKDGKPIEQGHFDEQQLELVETAAPKETKPTGGPQDDQKSPVSDPR